MNASCSYTNPALPPSCIPNGTYTYGSCSEACGNTGIRTKYNSCGDTVDTNDACNRFVCPSSCTPSTMTTCTASCGGTCTDTVTAGNCSTSNTTYANPTACSCNPSQPACV